MEFILEGIFFGGLGIAILLLAMALSSSIANILIDNLDCLLQGPPKDLIIYKKFKEDRGKQDPVPMEVIVPGSAF